MFRLVTVALCVLFVLNAQAFSIHKTDLHIRKLSNMVKSSHLPNSEKHHVLNKLKNMDQLVKRFDSMSAAEKKIGKQNVNKDMMEIRSSLNKFTNENEHKSAKTMKLGHHHMSLESQTEIAKVIKVERDLKNLVLQLEEEPLPVAKKEQALNVIESMRKSAVSLTKAHSPSHAANLKKTLQNESAKLSKLITSKHPAQHTDLNTQKLMKDVDAAERKLKGAEMSKPDKDELRHNLESLRHDAQRMSKIDDEAKKHSLQKAMQLRAKAMRLMLEEAEK